MNPWVVLGVSVAGGLGAALRYLIGQFFTSQSTASVPWGTALVNVTGSFALGVIVGAGSRYFSPEVTLILGTGLLGGYTTLSTASLDTIDLLSAGRSRSAVVYSVGMIIASVAAASIGLSVASG